MASCIPVVSTHKGAEGIEYVKGRDIMLHDDPQAFAEAIVRLLSDKSLAKTVGEHGHDFVLKNYDWDVISNTSVGIYKKLI
jgi:glycosyltransferase involved in cell wall biosynthesis